MPELRLRGLAPEDLAPLLALQHATTGRMPAWSAAQLEGQLTDIGRDGGRRVVIVTADDAVVAGAGYVPAGREHFVAPSLAADEEAAHALFAELERRAAGADFVRVSCGDGEHAKRRALERRGYRQAFAFVTVVRATADARASGRAIDGLRRVPVAEVPLEQMRAVHNEAFRGVPNAPEQSLAEVAHDVGRLFADGSGAWLDASGAVAGYLWLMREEDGRGLHSAIDSVGTANAWRGRGLGKVMVEHALARSAAAGIPETRALIASTNAASLALHTACGFVEARRRAVLQLDRPGLPPIA
ncbi:MAG: GNAT family N-acetyltransferase [Myxococcota bacterium]